MVRDSRLRRLAFIAPLFLILGLDLFSAYPGQPNFFPLRLFVDGRLVTPTQGLHIGNTLVIPVVALSSAGWAVTVDRSNGIIDLTDCLRVRVSDRRVFFKLIPAGGPRTVVFSRIFLPAAPLLLQGRYYVPVVPLYEILGFRAVWNRSERTVRVDTSDALKRVAPDRERCTNELLMHRR